MRSRLAREHGREYDTLSRRQTMGGQQYECPEPRAVCLSRYPGWVMNRVALFHETGGPEVLKLDERPIPVPGHGEVLIRVRAMGVNRIDAIRRQGLHGSPPRFPAGIGKEAAGEIEALGEHVTGFEAGQSVSVLPLFSSDKYTVHGEYVLAPSNMVVGHPGHLSHAQAASIWMMYLTAWSGLVHRAGLQPAEVVLIPAASGGIGMAAIQITRDMGARPIAITRTRSKRQRLLDAGADSVVVTSDENVSQRVARLTGGDGANVIFDPVGEQTLTELIPTAAHKARIVSYGILGGKTVSVDLRQLLLKQLSLCGHDASELAREPTTRLEGVDYIKRGLSSGQLRPCIDRTYPFEEIVAAHRYLESCHQVGKIALTVT